MEVRRVRLLAGGVALGVALSLVAGVGAAATYRDPAPKPGGRGRVGLSEADRRMVAAILDGRARAVRGGDRAAFLATVYDAAPAFQEAQERLFDNLARLPLASWREELDSWAPAATGPGEITLRVTLRYRLRDFDQAPAARTRYLTVRAGHDGGRRRWNVVGDGSGRGLADDPEIWDGGRVIVVRGRHSLVIGNPGEPAGGAPRPAALREIGRRLDAAVPLVTGTVGRQRAWSGRAVALVPADRDRSAALAGAGGQNIRDIAALATTVPSEDGTGRSADRIVISTEMFGRLNAVGRRVVIAHELTHVATGGAIDHRTPIWLIEGLADYVGYKGVRVGVSSAARELREEVRAGRLPDRLPGRGDFEGGRRLPQAYEEAWLACRMVAERFGEDALLRLYRAAGRRSEQAALREVLGLGTARFTAMWRDYLVEELT